MELRVVGKSALTHDASLVRDILSELSMKLDCEYNVVKWGKIRALMKFKMEACNLQHSHKSTIYFLLHTIRMSQSK